MLGYAIITVSQTCKCTAMYRQVERSHQFDELSVIAWCILMKCRDALTFNLYMVQLLMTHCDAFTYKYDYTLSCYDTTYVYVIMTSRSR